MVLSQVICIVFVIVIIGPHCLLSLLRLIFKAYEDLTPFMFLFHMCLLYE